MSTIAAAIGRILIALLFVLSGFGKLIDVPGTEAMITAAALPSGLAMPTGIFEILGGLALALGFMTRLVAILLAGFTLAATLFFHNQLGDPMQQIMALKNLAIVGGLLGVFAHSQMRWGYERLTLERRAEIAEREAAAKVHEAELRAARAEGRAETPTPVVAEPVDALTRPRRRWFDGW